jgi:hypothetical protein
VTRILSTLFLLLASYTLAHAAGPQVLSCLSSIDDSEQPYTLYSPPKAKLVFPPWKDVDFMKAKADQTVLEVK